MLRTVLVSDDDHAVARIRVREVWTRRTEESLNAVYLSLGVGESKH